MNRTEALHILGLEDDATALTGNAADLVPLVITTVLLAWAVKSC